MHSGQQRNSAELQAIQTAQLLRLPKVTQMTGLARSTIYRLMAEGDFPSPVKLAKRAVAWRQTDLDQWSHTRPPAL